MWTSFPISVNPHVFPVFLKEWYRKRHQHIRCCLKSYVKRYCCASLFVFSGKEDLLSGCNFLIAFPSHKLQVIVYSKTYVLILHFCSFMCINFQFYLLFCLHGRWPGCPLRAFALGLKKQVLNPSVMLKTVQSPESIHTVGRTRLSSCQHTQPGCTKYVAWGSMKAGWGCLGLLINAQVICLNCSFCRELQEKFLK